MQPDEFKDGTRISEAPEAVGDFYTVPHECISCGYPATLAPDLIAHHRQQGHCYFTKQPTNQHELQQAIAAANGSCVANVRYRGNDPAIIASIDSVSLDPPQSSFPFTPIRNWSKRFFKRLYPHK